MSTDSLRRLVAELCLKANYQARPDVRELLARALADRNSPAARLALEQLLVNIDIAGRDSLPLCQDCGYISVFAQVGQDTVFDGPFEAAVQAGINDAYKHGFLRASVIKDALLRREEWEDERPGKIRVDLVPGDGVRLEVMAKGGGSDNAGRLAMLRPTAGMDEIVSLVVETVAEAGPSACPPLIVGVGIGGSFDSVGLLAKKALLRDLRVPSPDDRLKDLEERLLREINALGIGPAGLGGATTALGVAVLTDRTHMACLPVAVNISCNQLRSAGGQL